jgi:hypothetical protein
VDHGISVQVTTRGLLPTRKSEDLLANFPVQSIWSHSSINESGNHPIEHTTPGLQDPHSYFNAITGIMVAARRAGYKPETMPMIVEKTSAKIGSQMGV